MTEVPILLRAHPKSRVWFWKPEWYWCGWKSLVPFFVGHDEYGRRTVVIGWTVTGRVIVAVGYCGDVECYQDALRGIDSEADDD